MITEQKCQERVEGLANEIAYNLINTVAFQELILRENLEEEVNIYYDQEEEISYSDLEYKTIQTLNYEGYEVLDATEYAYTIGQTIAENIDHRSENYRTSIQYIENELDDYDYPAEIDNQEIIEEIINHLINKGYTITEEETIIPFQYHCTPNALIIPYENDKNKNIKGLELEISSNNYIIQETLADLEEKNIIATPENWHDSFNETANIALEEDGSVEYELIFRAQTNNKIMEEVEKIQKLEKYVNNHTGTSAHIHINRAYIEEELGLTEIDITKAAEFLSYLLFLISGRTEKTAHEWARSQLPCPMDVNLAEKAKHVDRLTEINYAKYNFVNCTQIDTIEFRIFSNKCNFNKKVINLYLETIDFIIELADYMQNKSYTKELQNIIPLIKNHFEKFEDTLDFYNTKGKIMDEFKEPKTLLKQAIKNEWIKIDNNIAWFMNYAQIEPTSYDTIRKFISMVRILNKEFEYNYDLNINPETTDVQKIAGEIRIDIKKTYKAKMEAI